MASMLLTRKEAAPTLSTTEENRKRVPDRKKKKAPVRRHPPGLSVSPCGLFRVFPERESARMEGKCGRRVREENGLFADARTTLRCDDVPVFTYALPPWSRQREATGAEALADNRLLAP